MKFKIENNTLYVWAEVVSQLTGEIFETWQPLLKYEGATPITNVTNFINQSDKIILSLMHQYIKDNIEWD